jgi:transposase
MKAYSQDLRQRIVKTAEQTDNKTQTAQTFQVSVSTVKRLVKLKAATGELNPTPLPGRPTGIKGEEYPAFIAQLSEHNDKTLQEHAQLWADKFGVTLSISTLSRTIAKLGWSRKKRVWQPPSVTSNSARSTNNTKPS